MDFYSHAADVVFVLSLLTWIITDYLKHRGNIGGDKDLQRKYTVFTRITLLCNVTIFILYLGFCFYEYWKLETIPYESFFPAITWFIATIVLVYSINREDKRWPSVLTFWWLFSTISDLVSLCVYLNTHMKPSFVLEAKFVDILSLPFSVLLCFNALPLYCTRKYSDLEYPLLQKEEGNASEDIDAFSSAGVWSQLAFMWLNPLFKIGRVQKLELAHVPSVPLSETADKASLFLEESLPKASSLPKAIFRAIWRPLALNAVFAGVNTIASYTGPFLVKNLVKFLTEKGEESRYDYGLTIALIFFLAKMIESLTQRQLLFGAQRLGIRIRAALLVMFYKETISTGYGGPSNGNIVNFINVDVERIGDIFLHIHGVWLLPVQVFLAFIILYRNLGAAPSVAAILATILVMLSNTPLVKMQKGLNSKIMEAKDSRIKATSEMLKNIRILKLHSWESTFLDKLFQLRETERSWLKKYLYTCSTIAFLFWASPTLVSVLTFGVCILVGTPLTSGTVLSALATFRVLQEPIYNLPELISMITQTRVSIDRIQEFFREAEQHKLITAHTSQSADTAVEIETGEYSWDTNSEKPTIKITEKLTVSKGSKVAVCGSFGSGKSSLLCSILGEIPRISGTEIKVYGSKAYVPQSPWMQSGSVRDNILFGKEMDMSFYEDVLEACALKRDIEMWMEGDLSLVQERGMNLSGGQKQRIQLARAVYSDSDVYFLDDPFSAVDAHTGAHVFKKCLMHLLAEKTVIYVTHQLEFLRDSDLVLVVNDGRIVEWGKYDDLIANYKGELVRQMAAYHESLNQVSSSQELSSCSGISSHKDQNQNQIKEDAITKAKLLGKRTEEESETGRVKWHVYAVLITCAYKGALVPIMLLCHVLFQALQIGSNYWIAWATEEEGRASKGKLMWIFVLLSGGSSFFILGRAILLSTIAIETGQRLFHKMNTSVFRAPISFFDSTPSSRILSRSSTDQSTVDTDLPYRVAGLAFALIQLFSIIILLSQAVWQVFPLFLGILAISIWYQDYYITTARELARMVGIRKAPILHHFSESITGAATIRCFNQEDRFIRKNSSLIDDYSRIAFHNSATMEWLSVRVNTLFNFVLFIVLIVLVGLSRSAIDPSLAGLAVTYGLNLNVIQAWVIWNLCNVENKMISAERILQFTNIPSEAPLVIEDFRPNPEWPVNGIIELENLHVRYTPALPMVLKGISCSFPGEKKIGVVGRTGSGKSTLIQALFRVVEPSQGRILIDGVDICKIGLQDLRSRLSIIPQDPTLFHGTMRTNLDPLQQHSDQEIREVLNKCHLVEIVRQDHRLLDAPVAEDGENWSVGQRQLICLARVLLQGRRILVLDEATASVDTATDNVIQKTIREETSGCTVITVAHRIPTVIDNDLVMVLNEGKVVEYDSPTQLLDDKSSAFSKLVMEFLRRSSKEQLSLDSK